MSIKLKLSIILSFLFIFNLVSAEALEVGFIDNFRYSQESIFAGEDIRVYGTLQNNSGFDLQGIIHFYDNEKFIGDFTFFVADGRIIEIWTDWQPSEGEHNLEAKISSIKKLEIAKNPQNIELEENILITEKQNIDIDTDKDGIGNKDDLDDDNDGFSDKQEIENGTDSLVFDESVLETEDTEQSTGTDSENSVTKTKITGDLFENVKDVTNITLEKSKELTEKTKNFLEEHKEVIDDEIEKDKKIELAQKELEESSSDDSELSEETEDGLNFYTASIIDAVPSMKEMYSFFLGVLIYILNSWWILLGIICFVLWFLLRSIKNKLTLRRF
ncbi:MAG: hypothetical protein KAJ58_01135 [Candidatus Pacebacteria bacterium]|nr:hypothetical protein [Candidatus Paceibacterota bacterium]